MRLQPANRDLDLAVSGLIPRKEQPFTASDSNPSLKGASTALRWDENSLVHLEEILVGLCEASRAELVERADDGSGGVNAEAAEVERTAQRYELARDEGELAEVRRALVQVRAHTTSALSKVASYAQTERTPVSKHRMLLARFSGASERHVLHEAGPSR
ncbi:MAG: hypothetical protein ABIZ04_00415 [Opitutus sp.]